MDEERHMPANDNPFSPSKKEGFPFPTPSYSLYSFVSFCFVFQVVSPTSSHECTFSTPFSREKGKSYSSFGSFSFSVVFFFPSPTFSRANCSRQVDPLSP